MQDFKIPHLSLNIPDKASLTKQEHVGHIHYSKVLKSPTFIEAVFFRTFFCFSGLNNEIKINKCPTRFLKVSQMIYSENNPILEQRILMSLKLLNKKAVFQKYILQVYNVL